MRGASPQIPCSSAHHLACHSIDLPCRASFCIQNRESEKKETELLSWENKHNYAEDEVKPAAERKSRGSLQAYRGTRVVSACMRVCATASASEREEALKLKLLLQLCICSESLVWLTPTVFTLASVQMEQLWQQKKQVILLITCCSRQLRQDPFLWAQMKQRRLYWAPLLLLLFLFS